MSNLDFQNVTSLLIDDDTVSQIKIGDIPIWEEPSVANYLCFTAEEANSTIKLCKIWTPVGDNFQYSTDKETWTTYTDWGNETITLTNIGDKVYFKGNNPRGIGTSEEDSPVYIKFVMTGKIAGSGNIMTLIDEIGKTATIPNPGCFAYMFRGCTSLTTAPELPATALQYCCYEYMFYGCTSLTTAPELPATALQYCCYYYMFNSCTSLTTAPELPATTLTDYCYYGMFRGCTSLTTVPELPATTLQYYCYQCMFQSCTSLTTISSLPATTLANSCYSNMFYNCTNIKMSETQTSEYQNAYTFGAVPSSSYANNMFTNTGGTFKGTPTKKTYYTSNTIV